MDKYDFFSKDNILILAADDAKKSKKGDGINAVLGLLQELRNFMDKIQACADAQDITENRQKVEAIATELDKHYEELLELAKGGIKSIRKQEVPGQEMQQGADAISPAAPALPSTPTPMA